ncbi:metalloregulator ArsR/SmtB family transcription factor [Leptolinea tardivitalis]|uniref:ArsR family transcriptional regulator n=1 Tax=Leptolinea tardivitalis TaxID=229920 RepID=A0A0P6XF35_9CHLR|nr:metalloregulator ArsR/SmtB family transcription factor [Leptolinea tardivitalis]KPL73427.1 ArsR family transcriptional regulator [Leptolinea tardivitalis]GAP21585.1 transcriptional regulator [Leptolinea tardivitalis]
MTQEDQFEKLLAFFKALADENRLKIIGLLASRSYTVEDLADALGLGASTTSHHLAKLAKAGLVSARTDGHYYIYSLQTDVLKDMSRQMLQEDELPKLSAPVSEDVFEQKVLATFLDSEGRIKAFPMQEKKYLVILRHVVKSFEMGKRYTEKQVSETLAAFNEDFALLRRDLVDYKFMAREGGGREYWRLE